MAPLFPVLISNSANFRSLVYLTLLCRVGGGGVGWRMCLPEKGPVPLECSCFKWVSRKLQQDEVDTTAV